MEEEGHSMNRRSLLKLGGVLAASLPALCGVCKREEQAQDHWSTPWSKLGRRDLYRELHSARCGIVVDRRGVEVANPMSVYAEYKPYRSLWNADPGKLAGFYRPGNHYRQGCDGVRIGRARRRPSSRTAPCEIAPERGSVQCGEDLGHSLSVHTPYGQGGIALNAISGVDLALWDVIGKALDLPVYELLGGESKPRIPAEVIVRATTWSSTLNSVTRSC